MKVRELIEFLMDKPDDMEIVSTVTCEVEGGYDSVVVEVEKATIYTDGEGNEMVELVLAD